MKTKFAFIVATMVLLPLISKAQNPIIQTNYTADPAPMVHNGTVYLYTSHDEDVTVKNFFTMNDWRCYSTTDMVNWTDHGAVLSYKVFEWSRGDAWAGQCVYRNGKFYYYLPVNQKNGGNAIGVAVSDSPTGPFKDAIGKPLLSGYGYIDPTIFIDADGQAYMYWGNPNLWHVKLNEDMVSYDQELGIVKEDLKDENFGYRSKKIDNRTASYEEGPWLYKRNSLYYLLYPAGGVPEHLAYSTAKSITGPWTYGDTIMHVIKEGGAFTNHPGLIDFKGKPYLFYHNGALPGGTGFKRSVCVEPFSFNADGSIPLIHPTKEGVKESAANLNPFVRVEAETIAWEEGIETSKDEKTGVYVTNISNGDYIKVRSVDFGKGAKKFSASVASASQGGKIEIYIDAKNGILLGTLDVKNTGDIQTWKTLLCKVNKVKGVHDLYFVFKGGAGDNLFNFDCWQLK
ncbi:MAG: family 43 glycosylhydrolase [Paludibacter sp.]|nr:family 43 glycosylhydrolase [Paludibacter sp.]